MICCDVFDLHADIDGRVLHWSVSTDLPGGTRLIVGISREYTDTRGDKCIWSLWENAILLGPTGTGDRNGASGTLDIDEGDAHGLRRFNELLGSYSSGISTPVGDEIRIQAIVGARQPMKAFGKSNCNLAGDMVFDSGGINIVQEQATLTFAMRPEYQPIE